MSALKLNLLGTFQAAVGDHPLTGFRSDKVRALLIYLMVEADRPHRREMLAGLLWPDYSQEAAMRNLRKTLYLLRQAIDEVQPGLSDQLFEITRQTVQVYPTGSIVDLNQFQENLNTVKKHRHQHLHLCQACLDLLFEAAELYQGEFTAGFSLANAPTFDSWVTLQRETLNQEVLFIYEHLAASFEMLGDYPQAKYFAKRQLALEPWREKAYRQLMRVLVLDGRRTEALAQYENCRTVLWEELGVKPAAKTQLLYQKIKNGLIVAQETTSRSHLHNFPTQFTNFIGRKKLLNQIIEQLSEEDCRLLTLVGPGGIGKTRLSIETANLLAEKGRFQGGIYFVPLTGIDQVEHFLLTLASQLEISIFGRSHIRQHLINYLSEKDILLVLDNFEQLTEQSGLVAELLQAAPGLKMLVSSREALNIRAEQRLLIGGMEIESAVNLFLQAANKILPDYEAKEADQLVIREICHLVGGVPLAVEISAAWVKMMDVINIARQIKASVDFLETRWQDVPERHRSMKIIFEESWQLLSPSEQKALAKISIFKGGFSLNAVVTITGASLNEIAGLLDKSLVEHPGKSRYKVHELLRQFAQIKSNEMSNEADIEALRLAYARFYMELVRRNEVLFFGEAPQFAMADIESEFDNIRQAWQWAFNQNDQELIGTGLDGLRMYFRLSGRFEEGASFFRATLETISQAENDPTRSKLICRLLVATADFIIQSGQVDRTIEHLRTALDMSSTNNWQDYQAEAERLLGDYYNKKGDYDQAIAYLKKAFSYDESVNDRINMAEGYYNLGLIYWRVEKFEETRELLTKGLNLAQEIGYNWTVVVTLLILGAVYRKLGQYDTALEHYERGIQLALKISYLPGVYRGYSSSGLIYEDKGNYEKAIDYYQRSIEYNQTAGDKYRAAINMGSLARAIWKLGRYEAGLSLLNESIPIIRSGGYILHLTWQLIVKAEVLYCLGRFQEAWQTNEEGLKYAKEISLTERILQSKILAARLEVAMGKIEAAHQRLNSMLKGEPDVFTLGYVHYELWQLTKEESHAREALTHYREAYIQIPFIEYKERSKLLSEALLSD